MRVFRSDGKPPKIDQKAQQPDKDAFKREFNLNLSGGEGRGSPLSYFPDETWI